MELAFSAALGAFGKIVGGLCSQDQREWMVPRSSAGMAGEKHGKYGEGFCRFLSPDCPKPIFFPSAMISKFHRHFFLLCQL